MSLIEKRISLLEQRKSAEGRVVSVRRVIGDSTEHCEAQRRAMIDSAEAEESDFFIFRVLVSPEPRQIQ